MWWNLEKDEAPKRCDFLRLRNMLLKVTFPSSYRGLVEATLAALKKWLFNRTACDNFVSVKNTSLSQIDSSSFGWATTPYSPAKRSDSASQKQADTAECFGNPPLIHEVSTMICTRPRFRAAPLFPYLDYNLCPTLTAHWEPIHFSELAETGSRQIIHIST